MKILVTGGAGYIGSHSVRALVAAGHNVTVYDNLCAGHRAAVDPGAAFALGDVGDARRLTEVLAPGFDAVMHFAAYLNVGESVREPLKYYRNNVANTLTLLEAMQRSGVRRFVFSSTCATYGVPDTLPLVEDLPKQPISPYGASKLVVEWMLQQSASAWGLGATALRYFNACGAAADGSIGEDHAPEIHLIPIILEVALGKRPALDVFGDDYPTPDGSCIRDYIHVDDLASAHLRAVERCQPGTFEAYNVGTGVGTSVLEVVQAAREVTGHPIPLRISARRLGDPPALYANASRARAALGWEPVHRDIRRIVESAWNWHRAHPNGYPK